MMLIGGNNFQEIKMILMRAAFSNPVYTAQLMPLSPSSLTESESDFEAVGYQFLKFLKNLL